MAQHLCSSDGASLRTAESRDARYSQTESRPQRTKKDFVKQGTEPQIAWRYCERLEPGAYLAYCRSAGVYRDALFQRWVCAVQFDVLGDVGAERIASLTWYLNLGSREKAHAGRRSAYWQAWTLANGGPPKRSDRLSPNVFTRRYAVVHVGDTTKNYRQMAVTSDESYSVIREVLQWHTGGTQ